MDSSGSLCSTYLFISRIEDAMSLFMWLGRPLKCKFGGHQLAKNIHHNSPTSSVIRTICTECDFTSKGVEIKLVGGVIKPAEVNPWVMQEGLPYRDPYYVNHKINHEVVRWCEHCEESRIVMPQVYRCVYCKGNLVD